MRVSPCSAAVALTQHERMRLRSIADAIVASAYGLTADDIDTVFHQCDLPLNLLQDSDVLAGLDPKGFWRVDKDKDPELRHTVLTLVAFHDLEAKIRAVGGDREQGIEAFFGQNDGEGWMLPQMLRLVDYGLGHDERAQHPQPVASRLGPRFYDWQLAQTAEESWRECELHARSMGSQTLTSIAASAPSVPATGKAHPKAVSLLSPDEDE
jgi:hypothetical protein